MTKCDWSNAVYDLHQICSPIFFEHLLTLKLSVQWLMITCICV